MARMASRSLVVSLVCALAACSLVTNLGDLGPSDGSLDDATNSDVTSDLAVVCNPGCDASTLRTCDSGAPLDTTCCSDAS